MQVIWQKQTVVLLLLDKVLVYPYGWPCPEVGVGLLAASTDPLLRRHRFTRNTPLIFFNVSNSFFVCMFCQVSDPVQQNHHPQDV